MSVAARNPATGFPVVDLILRGKAPAPARAAAARGALPVPRELLLAVLVHLLEDAEAPIAASARTTLESFPPVELTELLTSPTLDPAVLGFFATSVDLPGESLTALIANPSLDEDTIVSIASSGSSAAIEALLLNQERLVRTPAAVDALSENETLNADQRRRLLDFIEHLGRLAPAPAAPVTAEPLEPELLGPVSNEELRALLGQMSDLPFINLEVGEFLHGDSIIEGADEFAEMGSSFESVFKQILRMNPAQRLRAALKGGREARQILVRDTNRIVASAVLRNPRLTEEEVVSFAMQKSLAEEVFRQIGSSRAWMSSYAVVHNLVRNPKTPQAIAMNNLARLASRDLIRVCRDRNIGEVIRRMSRKHLDMRESKPRRFKKH